jgi:archaemetzincin
MPEGLGRIWGVHFLRVGAFPPAAARELVVRVSRRVAVPCRVVAKPFEGELPLLDGRTQVNADPLLETLEAETDRGNLLVGLLTLDIGSPLFTFFFGRARLHGHVAIVSLARLRPEFYGLPPDPELTAQRTEREVLHELGHLAGLRHCDNYECLMYFASAVHAIDNRGPSFCPGCAERLPTGLLPRRAVRD